MSNKVICKYIYKFTTENRGNDSFENYSDEILNAIYKYNTLSTRSRIYKHIELDSVLIYPEYIEFVLEIASDLGDSPTLRPLHELSKNLLQVEGLKKHYAHNRFLRKISSKKYSNEATHDEVAKIREENTDLKLISHVVEELQNNNETFRELLIELINNNMI